MVIKIDSSTASGLMLWTKYGLGNSCIELFFVQVGRFEDLGDGIESGRGHLNGSARGTATGSLRAAPIRHNSTVESQSSRRMS